jgi:tRNA (mo5U34)-methyltransferase
MEANSDLLAKRRENPVRAPLAETGLYHSFRLDDGVVLQGALSLEHLEARLAAFRLPLDLTGRRVLDIGPWDGYFAFEMERRGADVTAIDYVDLDTFRALHRAMKSRVKYCRMEIYELNPKLHGTYDIVLCLGVLYHLKHPLLALEKVCAVTVDECIVDTYVVDGESSRQGVQPPIPFLEFYERDELGGQLDNWCGPTVSAVESLVRAAGFASAEVLRVTATTATVAAHRKWKKLPPDEEDALRLIGLHCHAHRGRSFQSHKEEYISLWCEWKAATGPPLNSVFPEVSGYGVAPMSCTLTSTGLLINFRVPPGLTSGIHSVRLKIGNSKWSDVLEFSVDLPPVDTIPTIIIAQDGIQWHSDEVDWGNGGWLSLWVNGLSAQADPGNTVVEINGVPHFPDDVHPDSGQINVRLRPVILPGFSEVRLCHRGQFSPARTIKVKGQPPTIRGLEALQVNAPVETL